MTSIVYIPETDSIKVLVRLDYDLFLKDYQQTLDDDLDMHVLARPLPADMANNYVNAKISITINKKILIGKLLAIKVKDDDVFLHMLYRSGTKPRKITVRNTILTGLYTDVQNLTIIRIKNLETGIKFTHEYIQESFDLK